MKYVVFWNYEKRFNSISKLFNNNTDDIDGDDNDYNYVDMPHKLLNMKGKKKQ